MKHVFIEYQVTFAVYGQCKDCARTRTLSNEHATVKCTLRRYPISGCKSTLLSSVFIIS
jgi:hypothetical protein